MEDKEKLRILISKCRKNDRVSQNTLFTLYSDHVMKICSRYSNDRQEAKEIFLNTFEKIFRKLDQYNLARGEFRAWISKIAVNEGIEQYRKNRRYSFTSDLKVLDSPIQAYIIDELDAEYLYEIVGSLKNPYNLIFNMVIDGYKHREIASFLNIKESTSRSYYHRAKEMIKEKILVSQIEINQ